MGGGFDKPSNCNYYILRWPRVVKIHWDRDWRDAIGFDELQELAEEAIRTPKGTTTTVLEEEEERRWVKRLEQGDPGGKRKQRDEDTIGGGGKRRMIGTEGDDLQSQSQSQSELESESQDSEMETPPRSEHGESSSSWSPSSSSSQQPLEQSREQQPQGILSPPQPARPPLHPLPMLSVINALPPPPAPHPPCPSPLHSATVFFIPSVHAQSRLSPLLALHKPKAVYFWTDLPSFYATTQAELFPSPETGQLASIASSTSSSGEGAPVMTPLIAGGGGAVDGNVTGAGAGKIILLIDSRTPRTSKKIIAEILEKAGLEPGAAGIDCYDWRVVGHSDWKGERRLDLLDKEKEVDASGGGNGDRVAGKGSGSGKGRKVDWDLFHMVSV